MADRKADRHKTAAIPFRPSERDGARLDDYHQRTGRPKNDILREALADWLDEQDAGRREGLPEISR